MCCIDQERQDYAEGLRQARIRWDGMLIIIPGRPIAKKRPRFVRRGEHVITYNPQETEEGRWLLMAKGQITETMTGPVNMNCKFFFARPKSHFGTGKNQDKLKPSAPAFHTQKPDIDNLQKFVKDCLNGIAYKDDCQIIYVEASKMWVEAKERTEITLM